VRGREARRIHDLRHDVRPMIGDIHHVATVAKVPGNTKAAAMRYIHADEDAAAWASQGIGRGYRWRWSDADKSFR
jgi:hypothetical protein